MGLVISEPQNFSPDEACEGNNYTNSSHTYQAGTCSACGWGCRVERPSKEFSQAGAEVEIWAQFEAHKAGCPLTKHRELYEQAGTATKKIAVVAQMLGLLEEQ